MRRTRKFLLSALAALSALAGRELVAVPPQSAAFPDLPLHFETLPGATDGELSFVARGRGCNFFITPTEAVLTLAKHELPAPSSRAERGRSGPGRVTQVRSLRYKFLGADTRATVSGAGGQPGRANYLLGNDPARWRTGQPVFSHVRVSHVYPGVDLVYYGNQQRIEYDFVVAPQADPSVIAVRITGADKMRVDEQGDLVLSLGRDEIRQPKPFLYQTVNGTRKEITGSYRLADRGTFTFDVGEYDRDLPLVIDPVLSYATFFGGAGVDIAWDLALGPDGSIYVAGETMSAGLGSPGAFQSTYRGGDVGGDAFIAKFDSTGRTNIYFTYLGGKGDDAALALALDAAGNAYITGFTSSTNFPTTNPLQTNLKGSPYPGIGAYPLEAFVATLGTGGSNLIFSTYLGGSSDDEGIGIALDAAAAIYVTGFTTSTNFPTANTQRTNFNGGYDAFVTKLVPGGTNFVYSMYLGGASDDLGQGIAADDGLAYVTGLTLSTSFPNTNAVQPYLNNPDASATNHLLGASDAFLTQISSDGSNFIYSTFLGGRNDDVSFRLTLDQDANVYLTGSTRSTDFPRTATNLFSSLSPSNLLADVFVAKLNSGTTNWDYSVVFGGAGRDEAWDVAVGNDGHAHLIGVTFSTDFPTTNMLGFLRATNSGGTDAFTAVIHSNGTDLVRSAYLGGSANDFGYAIRLDGNGNDFLAGRTFSADFPIPGLAYRTNFSGSSDAFLAKILDQPAPALKVGVSDNSLLVSWPDFWPGYQLEASTNLLDPNGWVLVADPPLNTNGRFVVPVDLSVAARFFRLFRP